MNRGRRKISTLFMGPEFKIRVTVALLSVVSLAVLACRQREPAPVPAQAEVSMKTIQFKSMDDLEITADLYQNQDPQAPFILLFHQARFSRGEYRTIAPRLVELGFTCLALDQRSGETVNGVDNQTHQQALALGRPTDYINAFPDLLAAVGFVKAEYKPEKLLLWGSSYSAALTFVLANSHSTDIDGLIAFSPGSYFEMNGKTIAQFAAGVECPVFMTSSREEAPSRMDIFEAIPHIRKSYFVPQLEGFHGSKALWPENEGHEAYWAALEAFLKPFLSD